MKQVSLASIEKAIEIAAKEANLTEYKLKEYPKVQDQLELIVNKMTGNTSFQSKVKEMTKYTGFESYAHYLSEFEKFGTKHSVQAIMPFDISVKNYSLQ